MKTSKKPAKKSAATKKTTHKSVKAAKVSYQPTYVALAVASIAVLSLVAFAVIGWSMSL